MHRRAFVGFALAFTVPRNVLWAATGAQDVIAIGGDVTEIVYALGQGYRLLARDATSTYPAAARALPDVGYMRRLSAEGVLSFAPLLSSLYYDLRPTLTRDYSTLSPVKWKC